MPSIISIGKNQGSRWISESIPTLQHTNDAIPYDGDEVRRGMRDEKASKVKSQGFFLSGKKKKKSGVYFFDFYPVRIVCVLGSTHMYLRILFLQDTLSRTPKERGLQFSIKILQKKLFKNRFIPCNIVTVHD